MKIGLFAKHAGLIDLLDSLWEGHDVRLAPRWDHYPKTWQGDEDIIVSTLPYDPESLLTGKPTIVYYTDPTFPDFQKMIQEKFDNKQVTVIGAENCYPEDLFIRGVTEFIPFAVNPTRYPPYVGWKPIVSVVNRKPLERWDDVVRGATGVGLPLKDFMGDISYEIVNEENETHFRQKYADNRVLFYYSNSPYTIVMFEAMAAGMPIVAYDQHHRWDHEKPIHKYLTFYSTDRDQIRLWLRMYLAAQPVKVEYPQLPKFEKVREQWNLLFERTLSRSG